MPADAGRIRYRAVEPGEYIIDAETPGGPVFFHGQEVTEIREGRPRADIIRPPLDDVPDNWVGEIHERDEFDVDGNRIIEQRTYLNVDGHLDIHWPPCEDGREGWVERMPADRLVARRVAGRQLGLVQHPNPAANYRINYDPPGNVIPPIMVGEEADGEPAHEDTGANPVAANVRVQSAWTERNQTVPVEADVVITDQNGEHYRPHITHSTARMDGMGVVTRDVRAVDRYGVWEIRYIEGYPGLHQLRVDGDVTIRRTPHQDNLVAGYGGRATRLWGTDNPTRFMWDVPALALPPLPNLPEVPQIHFPGADEILARGDQELLAFLAAEGGETQAAIAQRLNAEAKRQREEADNKAEKLLKALLTPEQLKDYEDKRCFYLQVNNELFRVDYGTTGNVKLINPDDGEIIESYCIHPTYGHKVPVQDVMLAQKLMLEADPEQFKKSANRWLRPRGNDIRFVGGIETEQDDAVVNIRNAERLVFNNNENCIVRNANVRFYAPMPMANGIEILPDGEPEIYRINDNADV